jgi:hypothetical protein
MRRGALVRAPEGCVGPMLTIGRRRLGRVDRIAVGRHVVFIRGHRIHWQPSRRAGSGCLAGIPKGEVSPQ